MPAPVPTLRIRDLSVSFPGKSGKVTVIDRISLDVQSGEIIGVIGESGSGKSMTALATMGMLPHGADVRGSIRLQGEELLALTPGKLRALRGNRIAMIPQDAMRSLNPTMRIGTQVGEPLRIHRGKSAGSALNRAVELMKSVHIPRAEDRVRDYPHNFSGGMQQRALIAMGLSLEPELIIADEPTTALDVTVQAQVLKLFREIRDRTSSSILFITHDLGVVADLCDRVYVMYRGQIMEHGPIRDIFTNPQSDYTRMLLDATPTLYKREPT